ncbi:MAG: preprotein translocase subunit YajC [Alistipes sp.]|nr:preprotein translocase subunit YajC [Alistipes sp.]
MNLLFIDGETVVETPVENAEINTNTEVSAGEPVVDAVVEQPAQPGGGWSFWVMIIAMIAIMYFFMWRPESKRRKQMEAFRKGLKKGDKVITAGGIYGTIKEVHETSLLIEVDSNVTLRVDKNMVVADAGSVVNK